MIDPARKQALEALRQVLDEGAYVHLAAQSRFRSLSEQDRRFAHELLMGTLQKLVTIDWVIDRCARGRVHTVIRHCLRLGVYQLLYLSRVPAPAACATTVELARSAGKAPLAGYVNGVMRAITRGRKAMAWPERDDLPLYLSVRYSIPLDCVKLWAAQLGAETTESMLAAELPRGVALYANPLRGMTADELPRVLGEMGISCEKGRLCEDTLYAQGSDVLHSPLFSQGKIAVQSEASHWIAAVAAAGRPRRVWDACAAPGGKTAALSAALDGQVQILATDVHAHRAPLIEKTAARLGVPNVTVRTHDAVEPLMGEAPFDLVLVDAPCSGLGTWHSHPDVLLGGNLAAIGELSRLQRRILDNAAGSVKPGGVLLYSTCTISRKENEEQVERFLQDHSDFSLEGLEAPAVGGRLVSGMAQLLPHTDGVEGFFTARLRRGERS